MSIWSKIFSKEDGKSHQLPSSMVAEEFGEVNICKRGDKCEVLFTILMEPTGIEGEGWQTGVALDASGSMQGVFGKDIDNGPGGNPPEALLRDYISKGWLQFFDVQGQKVPVLSYEAKADLVNKQYFVWTKNDIEPLARRFTAYLASKLDADGGTTVIYWACGDGSQIEVIGDLTTEDCELASFKGPQKIAFGSSTILTPAVRYFADRFKDATNGMYIFITDGEINDLQEVKRYTIQLCKDIASERRNPIKCVLIGIGDSINVEQMEELDDLDSGTDVDIWDHKIAIEMRVLTEIFAEVVSEHLKVAPNAKIYDSSGDVVKEFTDGLPAKVSFTMPVQSQWFELEVADKRIRQSVHVL